MVVAGLVGALAALLTLAIIVVLALAAPPNVFRVVNGREALSDLSSQLVATRLAQIAPPTSEAKAGDVLFVFDWTCDVEYDVNGLRRIYVRYPGSIEINAPKGASAYDAAHHFVWSLLFKEVSLVAQQTCAEKGFRGFDIIGAVVTDTNSGQSWRF